MAKRGSPSSLPAGSAPIIVTAILPGPVQSLGNRLREAHFPPERNYLSAHLTLFHAIPPSSADELARLLADLAKATPPLPGAIDGILNLGNGTALRVRSPALLELRAFLADRLHGVLSAQDRHSPNLHITVQNKVPPKSARKLQTELGRQALDMSFLIPGIATHRYLGGPWEKAGSWSFRGTT